MILASRFKVAFTLEYCAYTRIIALKLYAQNLDNDEQNFGRCTERAAGYCGGAVRCISAPDIAKCLSEDIPRRTLQYRLKQLVEIGLLRMSGSGRWAKYHLATSGKPVVGEQAQKDEDYGRLIRMSKEGKAVRDYITRPTGARKPVGYKMDFLDQYEPNSTYYYLRLEERERLQEIGRLKTAPQPAGTYAKLIFNRLLIDLAWNSSRLEGNTYSLLDTRRLIEFGEEANGRDHIEAQMILNHKDAIEFLIGPQKRSTSIGIRS